MRQFEIVIYIEANSKIYSEKLSTVMLNRDSLERWFEQWIESSEQAVLRSMLTGYKIVEVT